MSTVVVERLPALDYARDCVSLSKDYGTPSWEARIEVASIRNSVFAALDRLESEEKITQKTRGRPVIVKPNLVIVFKDLGTKKSSYPETTDPRVLDSVILWLKEKSGASEITIAESSGRGSPTRASFALSGVDRLAKHRGCALIALEEQAVDRYFLPKAAVQKEILVPRIFSAVVRGEACYISVPKMKTNLYTGVTLGFKNAMGVIPYNLRQRAHHYSIDRKLVEMLYLFKPDIVVIDGVVGGEGECPAPVDPVDSRMIVAGNHAVETDRVATRLMGFEPSSIELMRIADELGFGEPHKTQTIGDETPVPFRPADRSLISERVKKLFPNLKVLYGIDRNGIAESFTAGFSNSKSPIILRAELAGLALRMEKSCTGGCVASTRFGLGMMEAEGKRIAEPALLAIGAGVVHAGNRYWIDSEGRAWNASDIKSFKGRSAAIGSCTHRLSDVCGFFVEGCMPLANAPHAVIHKISRTACSVLSSKNRHIMLLLKTILESRKARIALLARGERIDVEFPLENMPDSIPDWLDGNQNKDWVPWPMPPLTGSREKKLLMQAEDNTAVASLTGILVPCFSEKLIWQVKSAITGIMTWTPLVLFLLNPGKNHPSAHWPSSKLFLTIFVILETIHALEIPFALKARVKPAAHENYPWKKALFVSAATLLAGFPVWLPYRKGLIK